MDDVLTFYISYTKMSILPFTTQLASHYSVHIPSPPFLSNNHRFAVRVREFALILFVLFLRGGCVTPGDA